MHRHALSLLLVLLSSVAVADEPNAPTPARLNRWGLEVEALQPFVPTVNILRVRAAYSLWGTATGLRGDLVFGVYLRPNIEHDVVERISEYQVSLSYRQYLWRGLHVEAGLDAGAAWGRNRFDGRDYRTPTLFLNTNVGYRFGFLEPGGFFENGGSAVGFFVTPQFGVLTGLGVADIGPRGGKPDVFLQGNLLLGVSF